jgi:DNA adenine methylase
MQAQPFVKWLGGKSRMLPYLRHAIPAHFNRYAEPMVGGGALFWDLARAGLLQDKEVMLGDNHEWLVHTYELVRDAPDDLLEVLRELQEEYTKAPEQFFYAVRKAWNDGRRNSARFIFLKQTAFNGLWRCNRKGQVNMPWGKYPAPRICCPELIHACSKMLQGVHIIHASYADWVDQLGAGDFVYFDPPYFQRFGAYVGRPFAYEDHVTLVEHCADISRRGGHVLYTHADTPKSRSWLENNWPGAYLHHASTSRSVSRTVAGRIKTKDLVVCSEAINAEAA